MPGWKSRCRGYCVCQSGAGRNKESWQSAADQAELGIGHPSRTRRFSGQRNLDHRDRIADRATLVRLASVVFPLCAAFSSFSAMRFRNEWSPPCGNDLQASSRTTSILAAVLSFIGSMWHLRYRSATITQRRSIRGTRPSSRRWIAGKSGEKPLISIETNGVLRAPYMTGSSRWRT
jgi:hypothetical protein